MVVVVLVVVVLITPRSTVLLAVFIVAQILKNLPDSYGAVKFIIVFTRACQ
jgi:hypothetical protein